MRHFEEPRAQKIPGVFFAFFWEKNNTCFLRIMIFRWLGSTANKKVGLEELKLGEVRKSDFGAEKTILVTLLGAHISHHIPSKISFESMNSFSHSGICDRSLEGAALWGWGLEKGINSSLRKLFLKHTRNLIQETVQQQKGHIDMSYPHGFLFWVGCRGKRLFKCDHEPVEGFPL